MSLSRYSLVGVVLVAASIVTWMAVDFAMQFMNFWFFSAISGGSVNLRSINLMSFVGDGTAWGYFVGRWLTLCLPVMIMAAVMVRNIKLSWSVGLRIGLGIVAAQWLAWILASIFRTHESVLAVGWQFYISRFWIVIPGPLAAVAVSKIDLSQEMNEA